jgi:hypothetical protein
MGRYDGAPPALLAQLVEHLHGKEGVDGSSPSEGFEKPRRVGLFHEQLAVRAFCSSMELVLELSVFGAERRSCSPQGRMFGV